jgi:hypothetical protein
LYINPRAQIQTKENGQKSKSCEDELWCQQLQHGLQVWAIFHQLSLHKGVFKVSFPSLDVREEERGNGSIDSPRRRDPRKNVPATDLA